MKWRKLGKVFDPTDHALPNNCVEFAQAPQALVLDDRIRVFFSTRERDSVGKFLGHVAFVDFDKAMSRIVGLSTDTVLPLGGLGCFDEHGVFPIGIFRDGARVLAYTTGWNRKVSVSADAAIGLAISHDDGLTFERLGTGPIMGASLHEPFLVGDAFVARYGEVFHMWYIYGADWKRADAGTPPDRVYKIAHALSDDAVNWRRESRYIVDAAIDDECQALPTVFTRGGRNHMLFCYRKAHGFRTDPASAYRLGYAWSDDLETWTRDDSLTGLPPSTGEWDSEMQCYPHVFEAEGRVFLLYNGDAFGRFGFGLAELVD